ncbi:MAG TPA: hypothetical protein VHR97_01705 [Candidatus Baltobacteraceae bacterium]|jgi:hypothetical protein|nr:hypothetical protein [Candidatus Baltobacteraceae bacterium]
MEIQCFWLDSTMTARRFLRRFSSTHGGRTIPEVESGRYNCPSSPYSSHDAVSPAIDVVPFEIKPIDVRPEYRTCDYLGADRTELFPPDDPRWPAKCAYCDYVFEQRDHWQVLMHEIFRRTDTGEELILDDAPPGAMWDAWYYGDTDFPTPPRPDGIHLMVRCPDTHDGSGYRHADWYVDGIAGNGAPNSYGWTRSGDPKANPPTITANPSIQITRTNGYHGWLRAGKLVDA